MATPRCGFEVEEILDPRSSNFSDNGEEKLVRMFIHFCRNASSFVRKEEKGKMQMVKIERQELKDTLRKRQEKRVLIDDGSN